LLQKDALSEAEPLACGRKLIANEALCPAASIRGNEIPLRVNSDVPNVAEDTVTLAPEALSEALRLLLVPTTTLPKLKVPGETLNCPAAVPEPASAMVKFGFGASETTEMLPLADPAEVGAKATPKVKLCLGDKAIGKLSPVTLNPLPVTLACVTVTLELPELVKVSDRVVLLPICTLPKLRLEGVARSCPVMIPAPETGRLNDVGTELSVEMELSSFGFWPPGSSMEMLPSKETVPLVLPLEDGVKVTIIVTLCPGTSVKGRLSPLMLKPVSLTVT
jgi:hypothetical protein